MTRTEKQYDTVTDTCRDLFEKKMWDYGTAWRILRLSSIVDQIFIKAKRIRTVEESEVQKVDDSIASEYIGIVNYSVMGLIQLELGVDLENKPLEGEFVLSKYNESLATARKLMLDKNHDYGEAWRLMQVSSLTDLILMKLYRLRQIFENEGKTLVSEGADASFYDMINYAIFALIRIEEEKPTLA